MTDEYSNIPKLVHLRFMYARYERIVRLNTESIAFKMGFDEEQIFDITLAVEEAYTNAIEHGVRPGSSNLEIAYHIYDDRLEVFIKDSGCGFDDSKLQNTGSDTIDSLPMRGRGLTLIRNLSDSMEIMSHPDRGTTIKIVKYIQPQRKFEAVSSG